VFLISNCSHPEIVILFSRCQTKSAVFLGDATKSSYSVNPAVVPNTSQPIVVHDIAQSVHVAYVQMTRPFDYSTSTWVGGNDCNKDVNRLKPVYVSQAPKSPGHVKEVNNGSINLELIATGFAAEREGHPVNVSFQKNNGDQQLKYLLKSVRSPPYIRFTISGMLALGLEMVIILLQSYFIYRPC